MTRRAGKRTRNNKNNAGYKVTPMSRYTIRSAPRFTGLDPHMYVTLKYADTYSFVNTTGVASQQIMNLNSLFDPDRTGTGHQPYSYDQLAGTLYSRYRVLKTRWKVTFGSANATVYSVVIPSNNLLNTAITGQASYAAACENPRARSSMVPATGRNVTVTGSLSLNVLNGVTPQEYLADDRFQAVYNASPAEVMVLYAACYNENASTVTTNILIELEYMVDFHDPIPLAQS